MSLSHVGTPAGPQGLLALLISPPFTALAVVGCGSVGRGRPRVAGRGLSEEDRELSVLTAGEILWVSVGDNQRLYERVLL